MLSLFRALTGTVTSYRDGDFSFGLKNIARFRGNLFQQRGAVGAVFRTIPWEIKGFDALGLPAHGIDIDRHARHFVEEMADALDQTAPARAAEF